MAPEIFSSNNYTKGSVFWLWSFCLPTFPNLAVDWFAYGVFLWELSTRDIPYSGMNFMQVYFLTELIYRHGL
jgi:hypothetical protein